MANTQMSKVIDHLRKAVIAGGKGDLTDGQLLECFVSRRDEAAVAAIVQRHGPMVWGVCRRVLGNHHDAEDAFQATWLVLVRKAPSILPREMVANWLYGVANQTALKARGMTAKRQAREKQVNEMSEPEAPTEADLAHELQPLLDQELSKLPDKYRIAIVLCDLEGKTRKEVACQLKIPEGTLSSRLTTARTLLAKRLGRHGLAVTSGALAVVLAQKTASACVPASVLSGTIKAASLLAAGNAVAGIASINVTALTEGVLKAMLLDKIKNTMSVLVVLLVVGLVGFGGILPMYRLPASEQSNDKKDPSQKPNAKETGTAQTDKEKLPGTWVKVNEEFAGKPAAGENMRPQWWHFDGDKLIVYAIDLRFSIPEKCEYTYALDVDKNPKTMEFTGGRMLEGPRTRAPNDLKAIYKIEGNTLTIAVGMKKLPTEFKTKEGDGVSVVIFRREGTGKEKR